MGSQMNCVHRNLFIENTTALAWDISKQMNYFHDTVPNLQQFSTGKTGLLRIYSFFNHGHREYMIMIFRNTFSPNLV